MEDVLKSWTEFIDDGKLNRIKALGLPEVKENNPWLLLHAGGDGKRAPASWNVKVYQNRQHVLKLVTTDVTVLDRLLNDTSRSTVAAQHESLAASRVISIDDSGWGFPIGGVLFGVHDSLTGSIFITEVKVEFFQPPGFQAKEYLEQAAVQVATILDELGVDSENDLHADSTIIKVCTGYVNNGIADMLRVPWRKSRLSREAIGEPLQSALEKEHRQYIKRLTGADIYYDPKELDKPGIGRAYYGVMEWVRKNNAWDIAKTGWKSMDAYRKS